MSKKNDSGVEAPDNNTQINAEGCAFCAIEELAKVLKISAPVFAAVTQANNWAAGKKIEKAEFEKAVKNFLNAPVGGLK
jgi:hypothetical protein